MRFSIRRGLKGTKLWGHSGLTALWIHFSNQRIHTQYRWASCRQNNLYIYIYIYNHITVNVMGIISCLPLYFRHILLLYNMYVSCHRHFFLALLLNQRWSPPLRLQASHCSTFRIVSKFFFKLLVTIPVAPIITGTIVHLRFHIRCISIHKLLYFNFFSASFCTTFLSAGIATSISVHVFSFLFLIIISGLLLLLLLLPSSS